MARFGLPRNLAIALIVTAIGSCTSENGELTGIDEPKGIIRVGVTSSPAGDFGITVALTGPEGFSARTATMSLGETSAFADLDPGSYTLSTALFGFDCPSVSVTVRGNQTTIAEIVCTRRAGAITGVVLGNVSSGDLPISGASVELSAPGVNLTRHSSANGNVSFVGVEAGEYTVTVFHQHFICPTQTIIVDPSQSTSFTISCTPKTTGVIVGSVIFGVETGSPISDATVDLTGPASRTATSSSNGSFTFDELQPGTYTLTATFPFMNCQAVSADVGAARTTTVQVGCTFRFPLGGEIAGAWAYDRLLRAQTGTCPAPLPDVGIGSMTFNSASGTIEIVGLDPALTIRGTYDNETGIYTGTGTAAAGDGSSIQTDVILNFDINAWDFFPPAPVFFTDATPTSVWTRRHRDPAGSLVCTEVYGAQGFRLD